MADFTVSQDNYDAVIDALATYLYEHDKIDTSDFVESNYISTIDKDFLLSDRLWNIYFEGMKIVALAFGIHMSDIWLEVGERVRSDDFIKNYKNYESIMHSIEELDKKVDALNHLADK